MPKVKVTEDEIDVETLEEAEYSEMEFESYDGEQPPKDTILTGLVKTVWWTHTQGGDGMLKILFVADDNTGDEEEYNGLLVWDNAALVPGAKFRWQPMMDVLGFTVRDIKNKMVAETSKDDQFGAKLSKIGTFEPGTDGAWCRIVTGRERYDGEWVTKIAKWLDYEETEEEEDIEEEEPEEEEEVEEEEEEEEEPPPARTARRGRGRTPAKAAATPARPARTTATARGARGTRTATPARTAKPAATGRGRRGKAADQDEPPF